jgi:hypothetical protein
MTGGDGTSRPLAALNAFRRGIEPGGRDLRRHRAPTTDVALERQITSLPKKKRSVHPVRECPRPRHPSRVPVVASQRSESLDCSRLGCESFEAPTSLPPQSRESALLLLDHEAQIFCSCKYRCSHAGVQAITRAVKVGKAIPPRDDFLHKACIIPPDSRIQEHKRTFTPLVPFTSMSTSHC